MTTCSCVFFCFAILHVLGNSLDEDFEKKRTAGVPFYWSAYNESSIPSKIRHLHSRLPGKYPTRISRINFKSAFNLIIFRNLWRNLI
ncbi:hypothetical protein TNCT_625871 [Trichonephila clavata]|uniref:Secreted protein n=1 Tax=Trichonephila clavata TaxID=2740835 RepID=A0A8X6IQT7_TRICU|nr:hypothetical protein TNCT_625871 [Trichonephila clavata]